MSTESTDRTTRLYDDPPLICRVTAEGDVICDGPPTLDAAVRSRADDAKFADTLARVFPEGGWGPNKLELALGLLATLSESKLPDDRIVRRAGQSVRALQDLLLPTPPSILLFNYSEQPANVMGAWYLNRTELARMQRVIAQFAKTVEP
jgi:hypothetical protein